MPILYVVAGPNGAGKTSAFDQFVPAGTDYVNADLIAKGIREQAGGLNTQELANAEAAMLFQKKLEVGETFAIETNLVDVETYKSFISAQQKYGYQVNLMFLTVDDVNVCIRRVEQRVREGGHNVNPLVIRDRYINGLKLLGHYKDVIDQIKLVDNTHGPLIAQAVLLKGKLVYSIDEMKDWASGIVTAQPKSIEQRPDSIEAAKLLYQKKKDKGLSM